MLGLAQLALGLGTYIGDSDVNRYLPNVVTVLSDSRSSLYADVATKRSLGARWPLNWANAYLGQRLVIGDGFGVSGDRTDQVLARLSSAIGTNAGLLYIQCGINDIAQAYPSASTSGATALANIITMANSARAAGMLVVIEYEIGSTGIDTLAEAREVNILNEGLYEYAESKPGVFMHDARPVMLDPDNSDTTIAFLSGYAYDTTHPSAKGARKWGYSLATLLAYLTVPRRVLGSNRIELPANGRRQLVLNPGFWTATGGTLVNGATGDVPASWSGRRISTNTTLVFSTQADAGGFGNNVIMDATFSAAAEEIRLYQDVSTSNWDDGDIVELYADIEVAGASGGGGSPTALASVYLYLGYFDGTASLEPYDLVHGSTTELGIDEVTSFTLKTRPLLITPSSGSPFLTAHVRAMSSGAGNARIIVKQCGVRRRDAAY